MSKITKEEAEELIRRGPIPLHGNAKDITGQKLGRGVAIIPVGSNKSNRVIWLLLCECGKYYTSLCANVINGYTKSCGCLARERTLENNKNPAYAKKRGKSKKIPKNGNSLADKYPELAKRWDYERNKPKTPHDINWCTDDEYWIRCKNQPHS